MSAILSTVLCRTARRLIWSNRSFHSSEIADGSQQQEAWLKSFDEIMQRLRTEATRRNKIVHSLYIFDFMEIGHPPLRSKRTRKTGEISFDQAQVDAAYINRATSDVAELSFDVGMLLVHLRHWYEKLGRGSSQPREKATPDNG